MALALAPLLVLAGCGSEVKVASSALRQLGRVTGTSLDEVKLSSDELTRLAGAARVSEDDLSSAATHLDDQRGWSDSLSGLQEVYEGVDPEVRSNLVGIACDGFQGQIPDEAALAENVAQRLDPRSQDELSALVDAVNGLWQDLYDASNSDDPNLRAQAAVFCFVTEQAVGVE